MSGNEQGGPLTVYRHAAMASDFEISVNAKNDANDPNVILNAFDEVDRLEELLSVFRSSSWISRINALGAEMDLHVPEELFRWLLECRRLSEETQGAFDITCSPLWELWGFARREGGIPSDEKIEQVRALVGMQNLRLNEEYGTVGLVRQGNQLNFGGVGKGIALELGGAILREGGLTDFLFHGGKSSALASGGRDGETVRLLERTGDRGNAERNVWLIGLIDPLRPERRLAELALRNEALGTSGSQYQFFRYRGKRYSHILDPRTGRPAMGVLSVSVLASSALIADALSTAFFVLGPDQTGEFCHRHPELGVILLLEPRHGFQPELVTFGLREVPRNGVSSKVPLFCRLVRDGEP